MSMNDGERFDTNELAVVKHQSREEKRKKKRTRRESRIPRWVYRIILILILCVLGMLVWFNRSNLTPTNVVDWVQNQVIGMGIGDGFPTKIAGSDVSVGNFKSVNKEAIYVSNTALTALNTTSKEVVSRQHSFSKPVMKVNGSRMLVYNLGGTGYQLESQSKTLVKTNGQENILAGALAGNGRYALITESNGYFGQLTAYMDDNKAKSYYWFSEYFPTAVALSKDGTKAAVTAVSAKDGGLTSAVYLLDLNSEKTVAPFAVFSEDMMMDVSYCDDGSVVAIGDKLTTVIHSNQSTKTDYDYQGLQLSSYCVDDSRTALSLSPYKNTASGKLVVLDETGKTTVSINFQQKITSVSLYGDTVAVLANGKVQFYSATTGNPTGSCDAGGDATAIALQDESSVYILGVSEIRLASSH